MSGKVEQFFENEWDSHFGRKLKVGSFAYQTPEQSKKVVFRPYVGGILKDQRARDRWASRIREDVDANSSEDVHRELIDWATAHV